MKRTIKREIWVQTFDENGDIIVDENNTPILEFKGIEEIEEEYYEDEMYIQKPIIE
jgi:hypothetical protein